MHVKSENAKSKGSLDSLKYKWTKMTPEGCLMIDWIWGEGWRGKEWMFLNTANRFQMNAKLIRQLGRNLMVHT